MRKPGIPNTPRKEDDRFRFDAAVKESLETIMGRRGTPLKLLDPDTAVLADVIAKVNQILGNLQE